MRGELSSNRLAKAKRFSANSKVLPYNAFENRKTHFCRDASGLLVYNEPENNNPMDMMQNSPMGNADMMTNMLKSNLFMAVMMPMQFAGISYFFSGMIVGKVAFPLTQKFREMLQKGVEIQNIDVKYISSLSLYFLAFLGVDKLFSIFVRNLGELSRQGRVRDVANVSDEFDGATAHDARTGR